MIRRRYCRFVEAKETNRVGLGTAIALVLLGIAVGLLVPPAAAQMPMLGGMLDPAIDEPGKPFSYFWHPTDVIGSLYAPVASEVTPEGYVYTGFGELMFFTGLPARPVEVRIKTLHRGYLPIFRYDLVDRGIRYTFTIFAAELGKPLERLPVNFVEVAVENTGDEPRTGFLSSAFRHSPTINQLSGTADYRFSQRFDLIPKPYTEGQTRFNPNWQYSFGDGAVLRDGRVLYTFPRTPEPDQLTLSLTDKGLSGYRFLSGEIVNAKQGKHSAHYDTPMGVVTYRVTLQPKERQTLVFKMPIAPLPDGSAEARLIHEADYVEQFRRTVSFWEDLVAKPATLRIPEAKVQESLLANTVFDLLAIDQIGDDYITNVNKFQYHSFYGGSDPSHMRVGFDYLGLTEIGRKTIAYSARYQFPDGGFDKETPGRSPLYEFFGLNLWCMGRHYQLTRDRAFLAEVYPAVVRAMEWEMRITHADALGLFPPYRGICDDAALDNIRQTGPNLWALHGMIHAVAMAEAMGRTDDARRFRAEQDRLRASLERQLAIQVAESGGWIPPAIEKTCLGNAWDNMMLLYPEPLFAPFDPRVTATIRQTRRCYSEGIVGYVLPKAIGRKGDTLVFNAAAGLHYWHTPDNAQNALVRGTAEDQESAVRDLYALLLHTTSTHAPQEFSTFPWSTRDYYAHDILPDGAASGKIIELVRNMLVREIGEELHLFAAVSPAWLQPGQSIELAAAPTTFGPMSAVLRSSKDGFQVSLSPQFRQPPKSVVLRIPWFFQAQDAKLDGRPAAIQEGVLKFAPEARQVVVRGHVRPEAAGLSFSKTVEDYQREYRRRYAEFLRTGKTQP